MFGLLAKGLLVGATAIGLKAANKSRIRRKQEEEKWKEEIRAREEAIKREQEEEKRRKSITCRFNKYIDEKTFNKIVYNLSKRYKRLSVASIENAIINVEYYSQSGITKYQASIDFNDYGQITGEYWLSNENSKSNLPNSFADNLSEYFIEIINRRKNAEFEKVFSDETNNSSIGYTPSSYITNNDTVKNSFPNFCRKCGYRLVNKPFWCRQCGTKIREKRIWYCAICGSILNHQNGFDTESGLWKCQNCNSLNRVIEKFY